MTIIKLKGSKEALHRKGEDYKEKVKEYMIEWNVIPISDSTLDGQTSDLVFILPTYFAKRFLIEGKSNEIWIECKNTDLSLFNKKFLQELSRYFLAYMNKNPGDRFALYIFIRKLLAPKNWNVIFDDIKQNEENKKDIMKRIRSILKNDLKLKFKSFNYNDFNSFINDVKIVEASYENLIFEIQSMRAGMKEFNVDMKLLDEDIPLSRISEKLQSNILKVSEFPEGMWCGDKIESDASDFWYQVKGEAFLYENKIYSVIPIDKTKAESFVEMNTVSFIDYENIEIESISWVRIFRFLIKHFLINRGVELGCLYDRKLDCIYFPHFDLKLENRDIKTAFKTKRRVSKIYYSNTNDVNYVRHDGLRIKVEKLDDDFYIILNYLRLFTSNGIDIIRGKRAKQLHYYFPSKWMYNNVEKRIIQFWIDFLKIGLDKEIETLEERKFLKNYFRFSNPLNIDSPVTFDYVDSKLPDPEIDSEQIISYIDIYDEEVLEEEDID